MNDHDPIAAYTRMKGEPSLLRVVEVLSATYTDEDIAIWLTNRNRRLDDQWPLDLIRDGHTDRVLAAAERIEGGI